MATVHDVAAYILDQAGPVSAMKLQKLCYYAYGYHLAWEDEQLFPEPFEAWANGPVAPTLYEAHRGKFSLKRGDFPAVPSRLTSGQRESIDIVIKSFRDYTAHQLSEMSHQIDGPWDLARKRASVRELERSDERLSDIDMFEYFSRLISVDDGE
ncbi:Panacea domain-containing protein [Streptomyces sp. NPDC002386]